MNYTACVVFPHCRWRDFPYRKLLRLLAGRIGPIAYVMDDEDGDSVAASQGADIRIIGVTDAAAANGGPPPSLCIVTHPYRVYEAAAVRPGAIAALLPESEPPFEHGSAPWRTSLRSLLGLARCVGTDSESSYLELSFRRNDALLLRGDDPVPCGHARREDGGSEPLLDWELLLLLALQRLAAGEPLSWAASVQRETRAAHYRRLRESTGPHETVSFLLAVYEYLQGRPLEARPLLLEAYRHAAALGREGPLTTHYRFLSAIHARMGEAQEALDAYGVSALTDSERSDYESLCRQLEAGDRYGMLAELFRRNDDAVSAAMALDGEKARTPAAERLRYRMALDGGRWNEAMHIARTCPAAVPEADRRRDVGLLEGNVSALAGDRHGAIRSWLETAERYEEALQRIAGFKAELDGLERLRDRIRGKGGDGHGDGGESAAVGR